MDQLIPNLKYIRDHETGEIIYGSATLSVSDARRLILEKNGTCEKEDEYGQRLCRFPDGSILYLDPSEGQYYTPEFESKLKQTPEKPLTFTRRYKAELPLLVNTFDRNHRRLTYTVISGPEAKALIGMKDSFFSDSTTGIEVYSDSNGGFILPDLESENYFSFKERAQLERYLEDELFFEKYPLIDRYSICYNVYGTEFAETMERKIEETFHDLFGRRWNRFGFTDKSLFVTQAGIRQFLPFDYSFIEKVFLPLHFYLGEIYIRTNGGRWDYRYYPDTKGIEPVIAKKAPASSDQEFLPIGRKLYRFVLDPLNNKFRDMRLFLKM